MVAAYPRLGQGWNFYDPSTNKFSSSSNSIPRSDNPEIEKMLKNRREEELKKLTEKDTKVAAVQARKIIDYRTRHFPYNVKKIWTP